MTDSNEEHEDYPIQPSGKNFQDTDLNCKEMHRRGLNYGMAKLSLDRMYSRLTKKEKDEKSIILIPLTITRILDSDFGENNNKDDCIIEYAYGRGKDKEVLFNMVRYSELVVYAHENDKYEASKNDSIYLDLEKKKAIEFGKEWHDFLKEEKEIHRKEKEIHKMACMQIEDKMKVKPAMVASEIARINNVLNVANIKFTGFGYIEDERYQSKIPFKIINNKYTDEETIIEKGVYPIGIVSYAFKQQDGSMKKGKLTINEFF